LCDISPNLYELSEPHLLNLNKVKVLIIYGSYPEVVTSEKLSEIENRITEIKNSYLIKDIYRISKT